MELASGGDSLEIKIISSKSSSISYSIYSPGLWSTNEEVYFQFDSYFLKFDISLEKCYSTKASLMDPVHSLPSLAVILHCNLSVRRRALSVPRPVRLHCKYSALDADSFVSIA
jgi:hypothetical protein